MKRSNAAPGTHRLLRGGEQCEVIGLRLPVPFAHHLARLARESSDGPRIFADFSSNTTNGEQRTGLLYAPADIADERASCLKVLLERVDMECGRRESASADERVVSHVKWSAVFDQSALAVLDKLPKAPKRAEKKSSPKAPPTAVIANGTEELPAAAPPTRRRRATAAPATTQIITASEAPLMPARSPASRLRSPAISRRASPLRMPSPVVASASPGVATAAAAPASSSSAASSSSTPMGAEPYKRTPAAPTPAAAAATATPATGAKGLVVKPPVKQLRDMTVREGIEALKTPIVTLGTYGITAHAHTVVSERNVVLRKTLSDAHKELQQLQAQLSKLEAEAAPDGAQGREDELKKLVEQIEKHVREHRGELARLSAEMNDVDAALAIGRDSLQHYADTHKELCQAAPTSTSTSSTSTGATT